MISSPNNTHACRMACHCQNCSCESCECNTEKLSLSKLNLNENLSENCCPNNINVENCLNIEEKLELLMSVGEECITKEELKVLLEKKPNFTAYDGFEPSGRMHIAQVRKLKSFDSLLLI